MKTEEIRNMTKDELQHRVITLKDELAKLRFQAETGNLEKPARVSQLKKDVARIKTILKEESYAK